MPTPAPSQITVCNEALDMIKASTIADFNENSLAATKCRIHYPRVISNMLEQHGWSFANQRVQMAQAGTNDRPYEWLYAYTLPANYGQAIRVLPDLASAGIAIPQPVPGQPYSETWATLNGYELPYEVLDGTLYTNAQNAWLDYTIGNIIGVLISSLCADAMATDLAWRLAVPVKGDSTLKKELIPQAELAWQRAIAADRNRQPQTYGDYISESMIARHSGAIGVPVAGDYP